ncbi:MAG: hypothetical protein MN733_05255 [Nitrososphaera sp.]|nr:hypothetical protein [Nitrososphaera sp.]
MTALVYLLEPSSVSVATDALSLDHDHEPIKYTTKIFQLPHLSGLLCGTGSADLVVDWFAFVQKSVVASTVTYLDSIAPAQLKRLAKESPYGELDSTIYHFGYDHSRNEFCGFAYRSTKDYQSEKLTHGLGIKPPDQDLVQVAWSLVEEKKIPMDFVEMIKRLRAKDLEKQKQERVGIGGEVYFVAMNSQFLYSAVCHRFEDYEDVLQQMILRTQQ